MITKEAASANNRAKFNALGIEGFEYIRYCGDHKHLIRCLRCGAELVRSPDVFKGRQKSYRCDKCGNGTKLYSELVNEALAYYSEGHSLKETSEKFGVSRSNLQDWAKRRKVSNGRTFREGAQECNRQRAEAAGYVGRPNHRISYYARARRLDLPREVGISLKKLIERDGLTCSICGLPCIYGGDYLSDLYPSIDHIVPMSKGGGHTWSNIQVAHRICNINKSNLIGKEWHNGTEETT